MLEELCAQAELAQDALSILWAAKWVAVLMQQLAWDLLRPSTAHALASTRGPARNKGVPTVAEGEILPGFPGVAVP